ncbi:MAG: transcriptional repressor [Cyanobacteria bacterium J06649_4]
MKPSASLNSSARSASNDSSAPRLTRAQHQVHLLLTESDEAMTAQVIYQRLKHAQQSVGLATVYRSLRSLQVKGLVQARALPSGEWVYAPASDDSHYMTCLNCGKSVLVEDCPIQSLEEKLTQSSNFQIFYHTLEFFGLCPPCAKGSAAEG